MQTLSKFMKVHVHKLQLKVKVFAQNMQTLVVFDELFYAPACVDNKFQTMGMLDVYFQ